MDVDSSQPNNSPVGYQNPFTNIPRLSKLISLALLLLYLASFFSNADSVFALNPGLTIPPSFRVWNLVTSGFYNNSLISCAMNIVLLLLFGKYLEPIWGSAEFLRFILIVNSIIGVCVFLNIILLYSISFRTELLYAINLCGFEGILSAFSVAMKQLVPEREFSLFFVFSVRAKHIPAIIALFSFLFLLLGFPASSLPHSLWGIMVGWVYLRFYQRKGDVRGDLNESFAFATFFPEIVQPIIKIFSNIVYNFFKLLGLCKGVGESRDSSVNSGHILGGGSVADMERRRTKAIKALEQRMAMEARIEAATNSSSTPTSAPTLSEATANPIGDDNV
eukprot:TRINITY_DN2261_c0_g3_i1.p1 TRINITY_DN2261_c0_g3~~TRINITY_DN2261_c0_g3_i1.p1  ORF type:complete len:334 (-),score=61.68 TRINITY_DN2261_c0_g3_i1:60-1061(-)